MAQQGKSVILTGAHGGVGMATTRLLLEKGYIVYAGAIDDWEMEGLNKLKSELNAENLIPVMLDLREPDHINAVVERVEREHPNFAALIPNGAACPTGVPIEHTDIEIFEDVFKVNVFGNLRLIQHCLPLLKANKGRIVMVGSIWGLSVPPIQSAYAASKHAMESYTHTLRRELRYTGIKVSILNPEVIRNTYLIFNMYEELKKVLAKIDGCRPEDISKVSYDPGKNTKLMQPVVTPDPQYRAMYETTFKGLAFGLKHGVKPENCARTILHAMESSRPKTRYWLGPPAYVMLILDWMLPPAWMDAVYRAMGYR